MFWFLTRRCKDCEASWLKRQKRETAFMYREQNLMRQIKEKNEMVQFLEAETGTLRRMLEDYRISGNQGGDSSDYGNT